jgi:hypothetical protein
MFLFVTFARMISVLAFSRFQYAERRRVHFERGNSELFKKESSPLHDGPVTPKSRLAPPP